jgi:hypothetical protein
VIISYILAAMTMAVIPWVLGFPVLRWHPGMQTKTARRTYRWATYCVALLFTLFVMVPALALLWFIPVGVAIFLDVHWYRISRTPAGRGALTFAKEEAHPHRPAVFATPYMQPPPYYLDDAVLFPDEVTFPAPPGPTAVEPPS